RPRCDQRLDGRRPDPVASHNGASQPPRGGWLKCFLSCVQRFRSSHVSRTRSGPPPTYGTGTGSVTGGAVVVVVDVVVVDVDVVDDVDELDDVTTVVASADAVAAAG